MLIETWGFDRLYRYLWGGTTDISVFEANKHQLFLDFMVLMDTSQIWNDYYIVALVDEKIVGLLQYRTKPKTAQFALITVHKDYRKQGASKAMIQHWATSVYKPEHGKCSCTSFTEEGLAAIKHQLQNLPFKIKFAR